MYIVEGNIGTGKSTFLKLLAQNVPHVAVVYEPRQHWQKDDGVSLLSNFYHDPHRWAYTMETLTMICRVREHLNEQKNRSPYRVMERSIYSGHYCFAQNDFDNGFMNETEWSIYNQWFNFLVPNHCQAPLGFIYLKTNPAISHERIKKRNRGSEAGITLGYLQQINDCHNAFLIEKKGVLPMLKEVPVLVLDADQEFEDNPKVLKDHLNRVQEFMEQTQLAQAKEPQRAVVR